MLLQILALGFSLFAISRVLLRARDSKLTIAEFLFWTSIWVSLLFVAIFPQYTNILARWLNIGRGIDVVIYLSIGLLFYLIFRLYIKFEEREQEMTKLVREIALIRKQTKR